MGDARLRSAGWSGRESSPALRDGSRNCTAYTQDRSAGAPRNADYREGKSVTIDREGFEYVSTLVRNDAGLVLESGKEYLVEARLRPLAQEAGLTSVQAFIQQLRMPAGSGMRR